MYFVSPKRSNCAPLIRAPSGALELSVAGGLEAGDARLECCRVRRRVSTPDVCGGGGGGGVFCCCCCRLSRPAAGEQPLDADADAIACDAGAGRERRALPADRDRHGMKCRL